MVKRFKKEKQKKARKQKTATNNTRTPGIKISEAVLKVCEPLLNRYKESHRIQTIASMGVMAWNISLFEKEERIHAQEIILDALPEQLGGEDLAVILDTIEILIERKERMYPHIREYILNKQISFLKNTLTLNVTTAPISDEIKRKVTTLPKEA